MLTNVSVDFVSKGLLCTASSAFVVSLSNLPNVRVHGDSVGLVEGHEAGTVGHLNKGKKEGKKHTLSDMGFKHKHKLGGGGAELSCGEEFLHQSVL